MQCDLTDDEIATILVMYERGMNPGAIAEELALCIGDVVMAIMIDAEEFPNEPLRPVLH